MSTFSFSQEEQAIFSDPAAVVEKLKALSIQGLLVIDESGLPLLVRDYNTKGFFRLDNAELLTGFISAIKSYAESISGYLTDIGLGGSRMLIKRTHDALYVLFIDEMLHQINQGKDLTLMVEMTLVQLVKTFSAFVGLLKQADGKLVDNQRYQSFNYQADLILLQSLLQANKMTSLTHRRV